MKLETLNYNSTDTKEKEQAKRKKHTKQKIGLEEHDIEEISIKEKIKTIKALQPKEKQEHVEEDETGVLENDDVPYVTAFATDISDSKVEVIPASLVTHILSDKPISDVTAKLKIDSSYSLISDIQETQEKETPLQIKDSAKITIKPSLNEIEPLQITEIEISNSLGDYEMSKSVNENVASKGIVAAESLVTTEVHSNMTTSDIKKEDKHVENAKTTMLLKDALNVSEQMVSIKESPIHDSPTKKSNATIAFSPLVGLNVTEVNEEMKESDVEIVNSEKMATSKLNFNLLESLQVGEVFVEDKSGKYYPELIVPTETARKDVLVSNQVITEVHNVQEREGILSSLKLPPTQEANVDVTSKDSLVVFIEESHEKEGELPAKEIPAQISVNKDIMLHTGLSNTVTTSHIKESEFTATMASHKKATVGINELQHKFNQETSIHDSERDFVESRPIIGTHADVAISTLDKNMVSIVQVHESEKDFVIKDDKLTAQADLDLKTFEPLITSETVHMTSTDDIKITEKVAEEAATETVITAQAKIITYPFVHDKESTEEYRTKKPEMVSSSLIPNIPLTISETELSECENKLDLTKIPNVTHAQTTPSHHLKTPQSQEINTADQIDFIAVQPDLSETASQSTDLQKEIFVLQTTASEQLQQLHENKMPRGEAQATFIGKESLNITEIIPSMAEQDLNAEKSKPDTFAKVDIDSDRKIALVTEVNLRDTLDKLQSVKPAYVEAQVVSDNLTSLEISETAALDSQTLLQKDLQPDIKFLTPGIISTEESLNVTEIVQHEKETDYNIVESPQMCTASSDITGRPVATLSEITVDSSLGFTEDNLKDTLKQATVENIAHKELIVSTIDYNEKELLLTPELRPKSVSASFNIDSNQAIMVEESKTEIIPEGLASTSNLLWANAKQGAITTEAITQQEVLVHSSADHFINDKVDISIKPTLSLTTLQVPQLDEKTSIEKENILQPSIVPDKQTAELSIICQQGLETSEITSHSDNIERTDDLQRNYSTAATKIDEIYGKTASTEEVITSQVPEEFDDKKIVLQQSNITPITKNTVEKTEIILGESETLLPEQAVSKSIVKSDFTETEAIITTYNETIDKEKEFSTKNQQQKYDATIAFEPFSSSIDTEIVASNNVDRFEDTIIKPSKALLTRDDIQKHIERTEIFTGEKELDLLDTKTDLHRAYEKVIETSAKEVTEVHTIEKEEQFDRLPEIQSTTALSIINEKQPIIGTEVLVNQNIEDMKIPKLSSTSAKTTHGLQEAVQETVPFIGEVEDTYENKILTMRQPTGSIEEQKSVDITEVVITESENTFEKTPHVKGETVNLSIQGKISVNVTQITSSEKEEELQEKKVMPESKEIKPTVDMVLRSSIDVNETVLNEKEINLISSESKSQNIEFSIHPKDSLNISENVLAEKEDILRETKIPKGVRNDVRLTTHKHINVEMLQVSEIEESIDSFQRKEERLGDITIEPVKSISVQETKYEEHTAEIKPTDKINEFSPSFNLEVGQHVTVTEVEIIEKEHPIETKPVEPLKRTEQSYVTNLPIQVEETLYKESEGTLSQSKAPQKETPAMVIDSQQHVTVTDTLVKEKEEGLPSLNIPVLCKQNVDIRSIDHITTTETVPVEEFQILEDKTTKDEKAVSKPVTLIELINTQPQAIESITNISETYIPTESQVSCELELHKSYTTAENIVQEVSSDISGLDQNYKTADKNVMEMKSIEQTEVMVEEKSEYFMKKGNDKPENADATHVVCQEIFNVKPDIIEKIEKLSEFIEPDRNTATLDFEAHKTYTVIENIPQEEPNEITVNREPTKEITQQLLEMKPIEQTEIITGELTSSIKILEHEKVCVQGTPISMRPISQSDIIVHESEIDTSFDTPLSAEKALVTLSTAESITINEVTKEDSSDTFKSEQIKPVTAEKTITPLTHIQCTENVAETQAKELITPKTQTETTKITSTSVTPLIVTDNESIQHETELHISEPKTQKIKKSFTMANEVEVTTGFIDEQTVPYTEKYPKSLEGKISITDEEHHKISISEQEPRLHGKLTYSKNMTKISNKYRNNR